MLKTCLLEITATLLKNIAAQVIKIEFILRITPDEIKIPVIFHNLKSYDSHFITQKLSKITSETNPLSVKVNPCNTEKYMAFYIGQHLTFIDSFQFMALDKLADNLPEDQFIYTNDAFKELTPLMKKKGVYPYDYMDNKDKFNETQLPDKNDFYSLLYDEHISDDQYTRAQNVWDTFQIKNPGEYHDYISSLMFYYLLMFLKTSERLVCHITN